MFLPDETTNYSPTLDIDFDEGLLPDPHLCAYADELALLAEELAQW